MSLPDDELLSTEQARLLARCYELILSWPAPEQANAAPRPAADQSATGQDSANDLEAVTTFHDQPIACSESPAAPC